jgi:hypothetical protein
MSYTMWGRPLPIADRTIADCRLSIADCRLKPSLTWGKAGIAHPLSIGNGQSAIGNDCP